MSFYNPIKLILELYYIVNGLTFEILNIIFLNFSPLLGFKKKIAFAKFQKNRFRIDGEIAEIHAILVILTASIDMLPGQAGYF